MSAFENFVYFENVEDLVKYSNGILKLEKDIKKSYFNLDDLIESYENNSMLSKMLINLEKIEKNIHKEKIMCMYAIMTFIKENFDSYPHYFVNGAKREYGYYLKIKGEFSDLLGQLSKEDYDFFEYDENASKKAKVSFNDEKQFEKIINNGNETKIMTYNDYREKLDIFKNNVKSVKI